MTYATLAEFKTWLSYPAEDDGQNDAHLTGVLEAADAWIDNRCGRHFELEDDAAKVYYPSGSSDILDVVDLISVTSIALDTDMDGTFTTVLGSDEYELLPYQDASGRPSERYQQVHLTSRSTHAFIAGELVRIVGDFGYVVGNGVPPEIRLASLILSSRWWKRHETPMGVLGSTDLGTFERISKSDPDVEALLTPYSRASASSWVLV